MVVYIPNTLKLFFFHFLIDVLQFTIGGHSGDIPSHYSKHWNSCASSHMMIFFSHLENMIFSIKQGCSKDAPISTIYLKLSEWLNYIAFGIHNGSFSLSMRVFLRVNYAMLCPKQCNLQGIRERCFMVPLTCQCPCHGVLIDLTESAPRHLSKAIACVGAWLLIQHMCA